MGCFGAWMCKKIEGWLKKKLEWCLDLVKFRRKLGLSAIIPEGVERRSVEALGLFSGDLVGAVASVESLDAWSEADFQVEQRSFPRTL